MYIFLSVSEYLVIVEKQAVILNTCSVTVTDFDNNCAGASSSVETMIGEHYITQGHLVVRLM